jgi:hypothetical protein
LKATGRLRHTTGLQQSTTRRKRKKEKEKNRQTEKERKSKGKENREGLWIHLYNRHISVCLQHYIE